MTAVLLNTAGGVTGGDRFRTRITLEPSTVAQVTTQAAERLYRAQPDERGTIANRLHLKGGSKLMWLPQETILFDGASAQRSLVADLAEDAELLAVEPIVFGRLASGESLTHAHLHDRWQIRRAGTLVFADRLQLAGPISDRLRDIAGGAGAMASLVMVGARADGLLTPLRRLWSDVALPAASSLLRPGVLFARLFAPCSWTMRQALVPALETLSGRTLPRPWAL